MTSHRLATGGLIDRATSLPFTFDGQRLHRPCRRHARLGAAGQRPTAWSARSFKYHRPRGILTAGAAEPNALVTIGSGGRTEPNTPRDDAGALCRA